MYNTNNPIPSSALEDMADNAQTFDALVTKTEGTTTDRLNRTRRVFQQILMDMGFQPLAGSFQTGATVTARNQALYDEVSHVFYAWGGTIPVGGYIVLAGSTPATAGGVGVGAWTDKTDLMLRSELSSETGSQLVTHKTQAASFVSLPLSKLLDLQPIYPEQFGAVAYGASVSAADMSVDSSTALLNAFNAAVLLGRKVVLTGRYKVASGIVCHYIQYNNTSLVVEGQTAWCALVFTSTASRTMLEIHGYRPILRGFRCENTPDVTGWDTKTAIKITGREGLIDSVWFRGGWKEEIWGVDFSESLITNTNGENDPFPRDGKTDNVGIGLRLNSCVNTNIFNSFHGYNSYVYRMSYLDEGETGNSIKPSSYNEEITWGCEGIEFVGLRSVRSMHGVEPWGIEISHANCVIDLNKYRIAKLNGVSIKFTDCWLASDVDTPAGETVWSAEPTASQVTVQGCTFDAKDGVMPLVYFNSVHQNITNNKFIKTQAIVTETLFQVISGNISIAADDIILPTVPVGQDAYFYAQTLFSTRHIGNLHLGADVYPFSQGKLAIRTSTDASRGLMIYGGDNLPGVWSFLGNTTSSGTPSSTNAKLYIAHDAASGRSINASGTINALGADYAEYMRKSEGCAEIAKGQIIGINSDGELTDKYSESVSFCVKSTNPNLVGNDAWSLGFELPNFETMAKVGSEQYNLDKEKFESEYEAEYSKLEFEREKWDRIAYCGQVPINVTGASAGDYIIPVVGRDDTISYKLSKTPNFDEFVISVGRVLRSDDVSTTIIIKM